MRQHIRSVTPPIKLKYLNRSGTFPSGNPRFYFRPPGKKGVPLPDLPANDPRFLAAYAAAAGGMPEEPMVFRAGTLGDMIASYLSSSAFLSLAESTRRVRRKMLDDIRRKRGQAPALRVEPRHIAADLKGHRGHARNNRLKAWRGFWSWAVLEFGLSDNPAANVHREKTARTDGFTPWTPADLEAFRAVHAYGTSARLALELIYWTGARVGDAIRLGPGNIDPQGWLVFRQRKTGGEVAVPYDRALPEFAEGMEQDLRHLHAAIQAMPSRHLVFLTTEAGRARSSKSVSQWFTAKAREAGIHGKSAHGLRKRRAEELAEAGATVHQAAAWLGHASLSMVQQYAAKHDRRKALSKTNPEQKSSNLSGILPRTGDKS